MMATMGTIHTTLLTDTLNTHIQTLVFETIAKVGSGEDKHYKAARQQLLDFIDANFVPKGEENARQE